MITEETIAGNKIIAERGVNYWISKEYKDELIKSYKEEGK